ncbi:hypothetical protein Y032_0258g444 [Ancylostoma ceylanicum]|uniref:Uncharacterized protein n=1 Tax=Ancylostoma ceylanicum TaxID=53326 RepID=A0A016SBF0_9BILA|nr:hypothetical protein Y032_0258g444 [Ancylostoma ceylanicum]
MYTAIQQLSDCTDEKHRRINDGDKEHPTYSVSKETTIQDSGNSVRILTAGAASESENAATAIMGIGAGMTRAPSKATSSNPPPKPPK